MDDDEEHSGDDKNQRARVRHQPTHNCAILNIFLRHEGRTSIFFSFFFFLLVSKRHNRRFLSAIILDSRAKMSIGEINKISCRYSYTNI